MKQIITKLFLPLLIAGQILLCTAQDLSHLIPAAHYTLINTADDALGLQEPVDLLNTPFFNTEGIYSNGIYISDHPSAGLMMTPYLDALYDSVFAVRMEFKFSDLDDTIRPVITCGFSYRWLGLMTWPDSTFFIMYNNGNYLQVPDMQAAEDIWYEVTLIHHTPSSKTEWYLDGSKVFEVNIPLDRNAEDGNISNTNFSIGRAFKGYLRNLRVYGSEDITAIPDNTATIEGLRVYPNPTDANLYVDRMDSHIRYWRIRDQKGVIVKSGETTFGLNELNTHELLPGSYVIDFLDTNVVRIGGKQFFKAE